MRACFFAIVVVAAFAAGQTGCETGGFGARTASGSVPPLNASAASAAGLSPQQVSDGASLYNTKCARCHKFYDPADYEEKEWNTWMRKMAKKSKLEPDQIESLSRYLGAFRTRTTQEKTAP
ncbi:MAG TPA: cytochrome c [Candidatus Eisenbacteria bacterium]|nr:cytochrome c [Candidatus Eisenbacteria bacterium]